MKKILYAFMMFAGLLVSCSKAEQKIDGNDVGRGKIVLSFNANIPGVKSELCTEGENKGKVSWTEGDIIRIWDGVSMVPVTLNASNISDDGTTASFSVTVAEADSYVAICGSASRVSVDQDGNVQVIPTAASTGSFSDEHVAVAYCTAECSELDFHNVMSIIRFTLPSTGIGKVVFSASDGAPFKKLTVNPSDLTATYADSEVKAVEITTDAEASEASYYVSLPGGSALDKGFVLDLYDDSGVFQGHCYSVKTYPSTAGAVANLGNMVPADKNYLRGGAFGTGEEIFWTAVNSDGGAGKGKGLQPELASIRDGKLSFTVTTRCYHTFYQKVSLTAGNYKFNANYYNAGNTGNGGRTYIVIAKNAPVTDATFHDTKSTNFISAAVREGNVNNASDALCIGWDANIGGTNNRPLYFPDEATVKAESWGKLSIPEDGDYYFVLGAEIWTAGGNGWTASYDNAYLVKE